MPLVAPGIARFTIVGANGSQAVNNVIDMQIDTTASVVDRDEAVRAQAGILINEWCDHVLGALSASYTFLRVDYVDLNSAAGITGSRTSTDQETLPQVGGVGGQHTPVNVAALVTKSTGGRRGTRPGRMFLGPMPEANVDGNNLEPAFVTALQDGMDSFLGNINQSDAEPTTYVSRMVVVHTLRSDDTPPVITYNGFDEVDALIVQSRVATQRRRLRD